MHLNKFCILCPNDFSDCHSYHTTLWFENFQCFPLAWNLVKAKEPTSIPWALLLHPTSSTSSLTIQVIALWALSSLSFYFLKWTILLQETDLGTSWFVYLECCALLSFYLVNSYSLIRSWLKRYFFFRKAFSGSLIYNRFPNYILSYHTYLCMRVWLRCATATRLSPLCLIYCLLCSNQSINICWILHL